MEGLYDNNIYTIYEDRSGNIWIGATGVGLYRYDGKEFTLYEEPNGVDLTLNGYINGLQSILEDQKGTLWLGFSGGLFRFDGESILNVTQGGPWH